ncbi:unnamed protein product [Didymodactylos carnosus]|uniref:Uncharacterized protein n=1 Tax=Didymodactylos carnosus TaxID=1234261 RepID=A0A815D5B9_9BILA|nr:unnamed protein product [Didymodactylos carnosus]CAF1520264.1 unnamed protein product [Didymodactylos carnosus]CAF4105005.1 unnamed protein product [Didymodactylos carnosus]CAF4307320.1 unnamed protein product [Didymodactylos carnosus]
MTTVRVSEFTPQKSTTHQTAKRRSIDLNDNLAIEATVKPINRTLQSRNNEICDLDTLRSIVKSSISLRS